MRTEGRVCWWATMEDVRKATTPRRRLTGVIQEAANVRSSTSFNRAR
jgi:hypothetical protein